jgi:hypothetical protein
MQKDMNIESLPVAIGYEMKTTTSEYRPRNGSVQSDCYTVETNDSGPEQDPEIPREIEGSDSPSITLRKKL